MTEPSKEAVAAEDHCPTCGQAVRAVTGEEGTSHYEGLERERWEQEVRERLESTEFAKELRGVWWKIPAKGLLSAWVDEVVPFMRSTLDAIFEKGEA